MEKHPPDLQETIRIHGHLCPGLLIGYRAAKAAMEQLGVTRSEDEELVAIVENRSCSVDAVQVLCGCTFGKGNLFFLDYGKQVFTIGSRKTKKSIRIALRGDLARPVDAEGKTDREKFMEQLLTDPLESLYRVSASRIDFPPEAQIFPTLVCSRCGEGVMETRTIRKEDQNYCRPCEREIIEGKTTFQL
jgi:formylmethanofuran dehydrogenase subunit E